jgi:hypothetical protein
MRLYKRARLRSAAPSSPFADVSAAAAATIEPIRGDRTAMPAKSQFFRAFVEGQTISDGRQVTAEHIDQCVETFNRETYTPGINIEHLTGFSPQPPFNRYGDVFAVKAQTDDIVIDGKSEKRRALYMQVDALDQLVDLASSGQKPFPSVELTPNYAGTGKVGLVGLAFTDNPASIATQKLKFSRSSPDTLLSNGAEAVELKFDAKPADATGIAEAITTGLAGFFSKFRAEPEKPKDPEPAKPANDNFDAHAFSTAIGQAMGEQIVAAVKPVSDSVAALDARFTALEGKLQNTPDTSFGRAPAPGGATGILTDC